MLRCVVVFSCCLVVVNSAAISVDQQVESNFSKENLTKSTSLSNFKFSLDLLRNLASKKENTLFSPFGVSTALGVVSLAAQGKVLNEINTALNIQNGTVLEEDVKNAITSMKDSEGSMDIATCIFTQSNCGIMPVFGRKVIDIYQSDIQQLNFSTNQAAAFYINNWVAKHTNDKITNIVDGDTLNPNMQVMITNAIYFRGEWALPFNSSRTREENFKNFKNESKPIQMMKHTADYKVAYDSATNTRILSLPYTDNKTSMVILLPREDDGLPKLLESLSPAVLQRMLDNLIYTHATVELPRFKLEADYSLKEPLTKLGITELFTPRANLTGIVCNQSVYLNDVKHKTFIEVEETGTTAAAVTGAQLIPLSKPLSFKVDHPFAFFIVDHEQELIVFTGTVFDLP